MTRRDAVWITGVGTATPLGNSYAAVADGLLAGRSGVRRLTRIDVSAYPCQIAGQVDVIPVPPSWDAAEFARLSRFDQLLLWCSVQALRDAGWWDRRSEVRVGMVLGLGAEWLLFWEEDQLHGGNRVYRPELDRQSLVQRVHARLGLAGPASTVAAACASGNYALAQARRWVERGWVDICLAGACDLAVTPMSLAGFGNLRALSRRNDDPAGASRPFDRDRDGFVMGEGGAMFVLEPAAGARRRGARAYAEVAGFGASSDAFHMIIPSSDPGPAARALRAALADAAVNPDEVDYLNAHATSTPVGDRAEARVLQMVLGDAIRRVAVSSTKSMTGHLLSAAAAVEALACLAALDRQAVPPTINLDDPDPECDLCHVPHQARPQRVRVVVSNSFGFGGSNACLVLRQVA
ncbi:MAG TPA: beta-ketoacyl-[acyl-carrier-protein] synthase family protein [Gemmataceae bacterium]|nr:beta-ketoacyl-[acyl-carrier-protein] synthase family protein [Gemmataceae bacterium]